MGVCAFRMGGCTREIPKSVVWGIVEILKSVLINAWESPKSVCLYCWTLLDNALATWPASGREAFVLSHANIERDGDVLYLPLCLTGPFSPEDAGFVG